MAEFHSILSKYTGYIQNGRGSHLKLDADMKVDELKKVWVSPFELLKCGPCLALSRVQAHVNVLYRKSKAKDSSISKLWDQWERFVPSLCAHHQG